MLLYSQSLLGHSSHPKHISVLFSGLSFLLTPLELPHPAPGHLPAWVPSLLHMGSDTLYQAAPSSLWDTPLSPACTLVPHPDTLLFPAGCSPHSPWLWHLMHCSLPHPAVCRHPTVAHWVFPGCPWHRHVVLGRKGEGEGVLEVFLISKFPFLGGLRGLFFLTMSSSFAFWKYSHHTFLKIFLDCFSVSRCTG